MSDERKIRLELTPEAMDGVYTNFSVITHTTGEFVIDFARIVPGKPVARVYSRIIMSPINFKLFKQAVDENLANYELKHGKISVDKNMALENEKAKEMENNKTSQNSSVVDRVEQLKKIVDEEKKSKNKKDVVDIIVEE